MPSLLAHRGAHARFPENTLGAFEAAMAQGADGVELDVRLSRTGEVVCAHDPTLFRLAGDPRPVAWLGRPELDRVELGEGQRVPSLHDVLDLVLSRGGRVNVEAKGDVPNRLHLARRLRDVLRERPRRELEAVFVSSFHPDLLMEVRLLAPEVRVAWLFDGTRLGPRRTEALLRVMRPHGVHPRHDLADPLSVARWHAAGMFVNAWTVNRSEDLTRVASAGVDGIITDDVPLARQLLD